MQAFNARKKILEAEHRRPLEREVILPYFRASDQYISALHSYWNDGHQLPATEEFLATLHSDAVDRLYDYWDFIRSLPHSYQLIRMRYEALEA
ncbi:MAG: hypothetical protein ACAH35_02570, partial [Candidatus Paceibacterota bacterium]